MPYPVYPVQNQTAQQLANIGSNLGVAMFGDANSMMRRKQLDQDLQFKQKQLDLQRQELGMKRGVYDSQASMNNAHAGYYGAQTAGQQQQNQGSSELADVISQSAKVNQDGSITFDPQQLGRVAGAYAKANPNGDVAKTLSSLSAMSIQQRPGGATEDQYRQAAALQQKMPSDNTAFTAGQATALAKPMMVPANTQGIIAPAGSVYEQPVKDYAAALDSSGNPAAVLPDGTTNPIYTPNGAPLPASDPNGFTSPAPAAPAPQAQAPAAPAAPSVADAFGGSNPQQQAQRPRSVGNAVVLPQNQKGQQWGTASSRAKSADKYGEAADIAGSVAAKANGLIDSAGQLHMSGGGIPGVEQVAKFMISADPKQAGRADLINQFQSILTGDWLNKSTVLKGAITEREGAELRKDQPSLGASSEAIKRWLEKVGYLSQMDAEFNQFNMKRAESGLPPIGALEFKSAYASKIPPPKNLKLSYASATKGGEIQQAISPQTAPAQASSGAPAVGSVIDGYRFTGGNPADQTSWQPVQ
jgi:hypothetical protein